MFGVWWEEKRVVDNVILEVDGDRVRLDIVDFGKEFRRYCKWNGKLREDF